MLRVGAVALVLSLAPCAFGRPDVPIFSNGNGATITFMGQDGALSRPLTGRSLGIVYDSMLMEGTINEPQTGPGGFLDEDYVSTIDSPSTLRQMMFVGGVETAGHVVYFDFYDEMDNYFGGFGVELTVAGFSNIWSITLSDPTALEIPAAGFVELVADDGSANFDGNPTNAAWRTKDLPPAIGSTTGEVFRMKLDVIPTPGALVLLGGAGLGLARRRR